MKVTTVLVTCDSTVQYVSTRIFITVRPNVYTRR